MLYNKATLGHSNYGCTPTDLPLWQKWQQNFESIPGGSHYPQWTPQKWVAGYTGPTVFFLDVAIGPGKNGHFIMSLDRCDTTWIVLSESKAPTNPFQL